MIAINGVLKSNTCLIPRNPKLTKEFFAKEMKISEKIPQWEHIINGGFFNQNGQHALNIRGVFAELFQLENLASHIPTIHQNLEQFFEGFEKRHNLENVGDMTELDLEKEFFDYFMLLANKILFSRDEPIVDPQTGKTTTELKLEVTKAMPIMIFDVFSTQSEWFYNLQFLPHQKKVKGIFDGLDRACESYIASKEGKELGFNLFDNMIAHNRKYSSNSEEKIPLKDFAGNYMIFLSAGTDTTQFTVLNSVHMMADDLEVQENLRQSVLNSQIYEMMNNFDPKKSYEYEQGVSCEILLQFMYEILRFTNMLPFLTFRKITTDCTLGKYNIKKGDSVFICPNAHNEEYFENAKKFDINRFKGVDKWNHDEQMKFLPFSFGKRGCLGKNFAKMSYSMFMTKFMSTYKWEKGSDYSKKTRNV